jgi:hypothetical protein
VHVKKYLDSRKGRHLADEVSFHAKAHKDGFHSHRSVGAGLREITREPKNVARIGGDIHEESKQGEDMKKAEHKVPHEDSDIHMTHQRSYKTRNHHIDVMSNAAESSHEAHVYPRGVQPGSEEDVIHVTERHPTADKATHAANEWSRNNAPAMKKVEDSEIEYRSAKEDERGGKHMLHLGGGNYIWHEGGKHHAGGEGYTDSTHATAHQALRAAVGGHESARVAQHPEFKQYNDRTDNMKKGEIFKAEKDAIAEFAKKGE